jgi:hypothetical protein
MFFDEALEKYKLLYRDGSDEWVSGEKIDDNLEHEEGYNLQDKIGPVKEPWHRDAQRKIKTYGEYCVQYVGTHKWGSSPAITPKKPSQLSLLVKAVEANVPPPGNIPLPIVKAVTNIVMSRLTSTSTTHPSTFIPDGLTTNTPGPLENVAPLVLATQTGQSEPSSILTESPSTSITAATTITQPAPSKIVKDPLTCTPAGITTNTPGPLENVAPLVMDPLTSLPKPSSILTDGPSTSVTAPTSITHPDQATSALHQQLVAAKLKLNVALLHKKLQEAKAKQLQDAKAQQLNMVLAGNMVEKLHPTFAKIGVNDARGTTTTGADLQAAKLLQQINPIVANEKAPSLKIVDVEEAPSVETQEIHTQNNGSTSKDNGVDVNAGVVDSSSMSLSKNADAAVATLEINVVTSKDEGLKPAPNVSSKVEGAGSLCNTFTEDNKDDVTAEVVGLPSDFLSSAKQVQNCVNY